MSSSDFVIPYDTTRLVPGIPQAVPVVYYVFCGLGFVIIVASFIVQFSKPASYGKFDEREDKLIPAEKNERPTEEFARESGCRVPQRIAHVLSDFPPGVILFAVIFFTATRLGESRPAAASYVMLACWLTHYIHRGLITPLTMRYSSEDVDIGICLGGFFPNCIFSVAVALHISVINYDVYQNDSFSYFKDPRFISGLVVFVIGFVGNRWSDFHLRSLRESSTAPDAEGQTMTNVRRRGKYVLPTQGLFKLCFCPNYFFEFVQWSGFAIMTSSLAGALWALFGFSTFLPRSLVTKKWYLAKFAGEVDENKAALIPFIV